MPDACSRSDEVLEQLLFPLNRRIMSTKKDSSVVPSIKSLSSPVAFQNKVASKVKKPPPLPATGFCRDARGSLEIFGTSSHSSTPVFASPAWHDALDAAESLLQRNSCSRGDSVFGDEAEASPSTLWRTQTRNRRPSVDKALPRSRPFSARAKAISPVSMTLKYGGSDQESDSDAEAPRAVSHSAATKRAVALTPNQRAGVSACEPPVDVEAQWRALLDGGALQPKPRPDEDEAEDHWQGVLSGGVEGSVVEDDERSMGRSSGTSSEYSEEAISEKAAQWGYEGPISASTELGDGMSVTSWRSRGSTRSMGSSSSGGSTSSQIPRVAKDVRDAITSFTLAFVVCDATGSPPTYPVLYASGGFFKMTGYEADEVIGSSCRFLQGPDTNPKEVARIRKALESGEAYSGKILNYKKDGTTFWNVLSMSPIKNNDGEVIKYIGMQAEAKGKRGKSHRRSLQSLPAEHSKIPRPISRAEVSVPRLSLPVPKDVVSGAAAAVQAPKSRYSYSLSNSRPSVDSAAEWQALARLRAEIVSSVRSMDAPEKDEKPSRKPRGSPATRLFRKLNTKISERLKTPEVEYVDYDTEEKVSSTFGGSDQDRNGNSVVFSRKYVDYRLDTPSEFRSDIPERGERLSSSHCKAPSVTVGGRSQFVIIH